MPVVLNISKIQSESNSQRCCVKCNTGFCCAQYIKDTIWKQFTTNDLLARISTPLCSIYQRYNLKAIHNKYMEDVQSLSVVLNISKIQSESNSQPPEAIYIFIPRCAQYIKDTIWKQFTTLGHSVKTMPQLCSIYQRYNLKAIHNRYNRIIRQTFVVLNISKIQSESNSQHSDIMFFFKGGCAQYIKDTIWKQFTTDAAVSTRLATLCSIYQRYNLKAIHNQPHQEDNLRYVVLNISKIQSESNSQLQRSKSKIRPGCAQYIKDTIWKQFTTLLVRR